MQKNQAQLVSYAAIDKAIIVAGNAILAANSATTSKNVALNTLYLEDMKSAVETGVFHVDGRIKSIIANKKQCAMLLAYVYTFQAKLLNSSVKKEISERGIVSYKLAIRPDFDKKEFKLPEKLNDVQKEYIAEVLNIAHFRGIIPPFVQEKETLSIEELRTRIEKLCQANGYRLNSELKLMKM